MTRRPEARTLAADRARGPRATAVPAGRDPARWRTAMDLSLMTIVGNPRAQSRTLSAALEVARQVADELRASGATVAERQLDLATIASSLFDWESAVANEQVQHAMASDVLIVASPTYKAAYTGVLKAFLDRFSTDALVGRVAIPVMVGGAPIHAL